jgi:hypothetical protein
VRINQFGFRDVEHSLAKPPGTFRIAVLGDSFAEAAQVPLEQTFWHRLAGELSQCEAYLGRPIETLNFGVSGYGTAQELQVLRHHVWQFDPDLVLLAFFSGNDLRNNSPELEPERARPFFRLRNGALLLDDSFLQHPDFQTAQRSWTKWKVAMINRSRVLQLVHEWKSRRARATGDAPTGDAPTGDGELGIDELCYLEPRSEAWNDVWAVTERMIVEMSRECAAQGAEFWIATVTTGIQVHPLPEVRQAFQKRIGGADLFYAERRIERLAGQESIPIVMLGPAMQELAEKSGKYWHGFENTTLGIGHWNADGHRVAAQLIAAALCDANSD